MNGKIFNLEELFRSGKERLREAQIEEADLDAWYLLEYITGVTKTAYYGNPKQMCRKNRQKNTKSHLQSAQSTFRCSILPGDNTLWDMNSL